jgi:ABC-2 type transport system ATP-binding protein
MIDVQHLSKKYADITAVDDLTFHVDQGEVFGLLGPNGAGKTTTIRMLCCLISKTQGAAKIADLEIGSEANGLKIRKMIGLVPDNVGLFDELSAYENLDYYGRLYECSPQERKENIAYFLKLLELWDRRDQPTGDFSKGMKQKVAIARALIHQPKLLFLDEPTANLDPESAHVVREFLLQLKSEGITIFLNTHNLDEARRICDRIGILKTRLLAINTPEQLERSVWGNKTVIQVESLNAAILAAVKALHPSQLTVEANQITIDITDPLKENPDYVQAIVQAGGRVQTVTQLEPGLEETYLKVIGDMK